MRPPTDDASARQHPGEPLPVPGRGGNRTSRPANKHVAEIDCHLVDLLNRSTQELRLAWRALRRCLETLAGEFAKNSRSFDPALVPKVGAILVRQWRGHAHSVLVRDDGFEYEGQHYRSLTVIAERITGTHWSGPRFFGLTKQTGASVSAEAGE